MTGDGAPGGAAPVASWACEAYGSEGMLAGALCFVAEPGERACDSPARCSEVMHAERQQLFRRINELSAADGGSHAELYAALERDFANPEHLLGGDGDQ